MAGYSRSPTTTSSPGRQSIPAATLEIPSVVLATNATEWSSAPTSAAARALAASTVFMFGPQERIPRSTHEAVTPDTASATGTGIGDCEAALK